MSLAMLTRFISSEHPEFGLSMSHHYVCLDTLLSKTPLDIHELLPA